MNHAERRFLDNITSLPSLKVPKLHRVITGVIIFLVLAAGLILYFTPWIQTAYGTGMVDSLDPKDRTQPINEPIVTLIDIDAQRLEKLRSQLSAANLKNQANETAVRNAENNLARQQSLQEQGLVSRKEVEQAEIKVQELRAKAAAIRRCVYVRKVGRYSWAVYSSRCKTQRSRYRERVRRTAG